MFKNLKNMAFRNTVLTMISLSVLATFVGVVGNTEVGAALIPEYQSVAYWACAVILFFALAALVAVLKEGYHQDKERKQVRILRAHLDDPTKTAEIKLSELFTGKIGLNPSSMVGRFVRRVGFSKLTNDQYRIDVDSFADDLEIELDRPVSRIGNAAAYLTGMGLFGTFLGLTLSTMNMDWTVLSSGDFQAIFDLFGTIVGSLATAFLTTLYGLFFNIYISKIHDRLEENVVEMTNEVTILFRTRVAPVLNDSVRVVPVMEEWKKLQPADFPTEISDNGGA